MPCITGWTQICFVVKNELELLIPLPPLPSAGIVSTHLHSRVIECWGLNPGLLAHEGSILPPELYPWSSLLLYHLLCSMKSTYNLRWNQEWVENLKTYMN